MMDPTPSNRRRTRRALVAFAVKQMIDGRVILCQANDLSSEGIFMACVMEQLTQLQAQCQLEFSLPGSQLVIKVPGEVVRQEIHGRYLLSAVRFASLSPLCRRLIQRYIESPTQEPPSIPAFLPTARAKSGSRSNSSPPPSA